MPTAVSPPDKQKVPDLSAQLPKLVPRRRPKASQEPPLNPPPPTPALVAAPSEEELREWRFLKPTRRILSPKDHELFLKSSTNDLVTAFVFTLSDSIQDTTISQVKQRPQDAIIDTLLHMLDEAEQIVAECPPEDTGSRFGNPAFRSFLDKTETKLPEWHSAHLHLPSEPCMQEVQTYLQHSFGNWTRIDYGSGHELNFMLWLLCLNRLHLLPSTTFPHLALIVFPRYVALMRKIQTTYYLEPAGSHGVWGLDDYQFLPFLFGSSQLLHHPHIRPMSIHTQMILEECGKDYLYLDQVSFVNSVKNVDGLRWHSPMLDDISSAKNWEKVDAGMRRMFVAEVLGKLPVMQHFWFGSLVPAVEGMSSEHGDEAGAVHSHVHADGSTHIVGAGGEERKTWDDCCGIKVPSAVGAMGELKRSGQDMGLRRLPFD
ncbi:hypothetical protein AAFC00_004938 [Neodothiora populina]|uniref:Serine/threonine-protein phosphatase 2A activator n=1 Tax=Neodothiora populina TaxID=2781224 RepID=A0ABR3P3N7_9PEZI